MKTIDDLIEYYKKMEAAIQGLDSGKLPKVEWRFIKDNETYDPNNLQQPSLLKTVPSITTDGTDLPPPKGEK